MKIFRIVNLGLSIPIFSTALNKSYKLQFYQNILIYLEYVFEIRHYQNDSVFWSLFFFECNCHDGVTES